MLAFIIGVVVGAIAHHYWPQIKAKLLSWYDAAVAKI